MVRLDRMVLSGFKSFATKIVIPFPEGFNVIAGPNGSGKSNIIDAIMFVLGVTSAKSIRAQKLQNLIFNGSPNRKPAEMCEISLYLDNSDEKIPFEKDIKITRKISRSGVSIYKLNGKSVTRSKLQDLMSHAGLSSDGYNIIMQGDVTKIIEMSPSERRGIIDDISGISEFDEKKDKATKELERVEFRVRENMIVVFEKQRLVDKLKQEKENAEKFQKLDIERMKLKASLNKKKIERAKEQQEKTENNIKESTEKFDSLDKEFNSIEKDLEEKEKTSQVKIEKIIEKSRNYDVIKKIDFLQSNILRKKDKIDLNDREILRLRNFTFDPVVKSVLESGIPGVRGTIGSLIKIPGKYSIALDVAIGRRINDLIVDYEETATECIKYLKNKKIGRARFLPLESVKKYKKEYNGKEKFHYAIDLIEFDSKFKPALEHILGSTLVVDDISTAKRIAGFRVVTLDGDLIETSRAMIGGFYKSKNKTYYNEIKNLEEESGKLQREIDEMEKQLDELKNKKEEETEEVEKLQTEKTEEEEKIDELKNRRKKLYEERLILQNSISKFKIEKAKLEANVDNIKIESEEFKEIKKFYDLPEEELKEKIRQTVIAINNLGPINMKSIEEFNSINIEFEEMKKKLDKLLEEKDSVVKVVEEVEKKRRDKFITTLKEINNHFSQIYKDLSNGYGDIRLEENDINSGLIIEASPEGKKIINLDSMSGGEKTLTSLSFLFAIMQHRASPFYILDEVDAALDKSNTKKIINLVKKYSKEKQFIVISHNDFTIQESDKVFGISMEDGVSKIFGIEMPKNN